MEENNNNSFIIKVLAGTLIAILALNVYRTESLKKQMESHSGTVQQLQERLDSLEHPNFAELGTLPTEAGKEYSDLARSVKALQNKVNALQSSVDQISKSSQRAQSSTSSSAAKPASSISTSSSSSPSVSSSNGRVSVSAKVKVEDRFVEKTVLPQVSSGPEGTVVISITIDPGGNVSGAKIGSGTTIKDEDILDKCKEAALKSKFNINVYVSSKHPGTITYTFMAK